MAKFMISPEGAGAMRQLSRRILMSANEMVEANKALERRILSLSDGLGIYGAPILEIERKNSALLKQNYDSIMDLARKAAERADDIERLTGGCRPEGAGMGGPGGSRVGTEFRGLKPDRTSPRHLSCTMYGFHSDSDGNLVYDSPLEMDAYLCRKQGRASIWYQGTCGLCSCANILRLAGVEATEKEMLDYAANTTRPDSSETLCEKGHVVNPGLNGATSSEDRRAILEHFGISSRLSDVAKDQDGKNSDSNMETIAGYVEEGRGVILSVHADMLWNDAPYSKGNYHAVTVTSVKKDPSGRILGFYICDSAKNGTKFYQAEKIKNALTGSKMNVTDQIIR